MLRVGGILQSSLTNGPGARYVIFTSGCSHDCKGCHNKELQAYSYGKDMTTYELFDDIMRYYRAGLIEGVTISGGEPFDQHSQLETLLERLYAEQIDIWIYSGYTFEQAKEMNERVLHLANVMVDGKFDIQLMDNKIKFRGSNNQRIIDLCETFKYNQIITRNYDGSDTNENVS